MKGTTSRTIRFVPGAGTFISTLTSPRGDLYQYYQGALADNKVSPEYNSTNPLQISLRVFDTAKQVYLQGTDFASVDWYIGSVAPTDRITFDAGTGISSGNTNANLNGLFKALPGALEIRGNLAAALGGNSSYLIAIGTRTGVGGGSDTFTAQMPITILKMVEDSYSCHIYGVPSLSLTEHGTPITLKAAVYRGLTEITGALSAKGLQARWHLYSGATKPAAPTATTDTMQVTDAQINSSEMVMVEIIDKGDPGQKSVCRDMATVYDDTDPIIVVANPTPEDETIYEYGGNGKVEYEPFIATRSDPDTPLPDSVQFSCYLMDPAGVTMPKAATKVNGRDRFEVDVADCRQMGGDVTVIIEAAI